MRLYTFVHAPNPLKVRIALSELGIEYEPVEVDLFRGEHRSEGLAALAALAPHRKVPVLEDGLFVIRESNAILAYLGRTRATPRWPNVATSEALALEWLFFESSQMAGSCGVIWWTDVVAPHLGRAGAAAAVVERAAEELSRSLDVLEAHLEGRRFVLGDAHTLVDCSVGVAVAMLRTTRLDDAARWPRVVDYRERIRGRASWAEAGGDAITELVQV